MAKSNVAILRRCGCLAVVVLTAAGVLSAQEAMHLRPPHDVPLDTTVEVAAASLPDAPEPEPDVLAMQVQLPRPRTNYPAFRPLFGDPLSKYRTVINPGEPVQVWHFKERIVASLDESFFPTAIALDAAEAGVNHIENNDPKYGTDSGAYGERFGATVLRSASDNILSDGILSGVFHEDPRYYRRPDLPFWHRVGYASSDAFLSYSNDHRRVFDYSGILGRAIGSALTLTYYPRPSANMAVVGRTFGYSLAGEAGGALFDEFFPDLLAKVWHPKSQQ